ncbi:MAG: hypothetical protein QXX95_03635 [Nitrososphaerales archaeon]
MSEVNILLESVNSLLGVLLALSLLFLSRIFMDTKLRTSFNIFLMAALMLIIRQALAIFNGSLGFPLEILTTVMAGLFIAGFYSMRKNFLRMLVC